MNWLHEEALGHDKYGEHDKYRRCVSAVELIRSRVSPAISQLIRLQSYSLKEIFNRHVEYLLPKYTRRLWSRCKLIYLRCSELHGSMNVHVSCHGLNVSIEPADRPCSLVDIFECRVYGSC